MIEPSQISWAINTSVTETRPHGVTPAEIRTEIRKSLEKALVPSILGKHADHVFVDTITFDKTNPFYVTTIIPSVKNVIFHPPATVILWGDGTKTVVKCREGETYDPEVGLAMFLCKKMLGTDYRRWFKNRLKKGRWQNDRDVR